MASRKQAEINELLRREISNIILYELGDPRTGMVTITRVEVAGDYRSAKVFITVRGDEKDVRRTLRALAHARGHIQALIADRIKLRWTPVLEFFEDKELVEALRIEKLLDQVNRSRAARADGEQERGGPADPADDPLKDDPESAGSEETS